MDAPPVESTDGTFAGTGGCTLSHRRWSPAAGAPVRGTVVVSHGLGEHGGRHDRLARNLAGRGFDVWALDHRGHGRSAGRRVYVDAFEQFVADLEAFRQLATAGAPADRPAVLFGHSMGGEIATAHAIDHPGAFDLLVLTGPLLQPGRSVPAPLVAISRVVSKVAPKLVVMRVDSKQLSRDPAVVAAYRADPLVHQGKVTARLGEQLLTRAARFPDELGRITVPVLLVHGSEDELVPIAGSRELVGRFGSEDVTFIEEDGLAHEVLNEPEHERVLATIAGWLDERVGRVAAAKAGAGAATEPHAGAATEPGA